MLSAKTSISQGRFLRVDLTTRRITEQVYDEKTMKSCVGGTGIGARVLYDEVKPGISWSDPDNRIIIASGPLGGTRVTGSGTFSVVTKGCLTNGGTATQANGYLGAFLRSNGLFGLIIQGASAGWVYLYIHDSKAELRDAT